MAELRSQIEQKFAMEANELREIVNQAQEEFTRIRAEVNQTQAGMQTLFEGTKEELHLVKQQMGATNDAMQMLLRDTQKVVNWCVRTRLACIRTCLWIFKINCVEFGRRAVGNTVLRRPT